MGVLAEVGRLAVGAWSSGGIGGGYIAAGSYGGSVEASFSNNTTPSSLEIFAVDIARAKLSTVTQVPTPDKFCAIDWSIPSRSHPAGLIAGGLSDGTVRVWDAASLLRPSPGKDDNRGLLYGGASTKKHHTAAVRSLEFNPFLPTRLATGGSDGGILEWDLTNTTNGPSIRNLTQNDQQAQNTIKEQITAVSWNRKVQHILGTATAAGVMNAWDLRHGTQVISIRNPRGRLPCSSLTWHPEVPTQVVITCSEDDSTGALLWDLRNPSKPIMTYTHHTPKGVLSTSWCSHDTDLLLTSSADSRTMAVSVSTGEFVAEGPQAANANFDVKWSPRIPGMYLSSSLDGRLSVNSLLAATSAPAVTSETVNAVVESFGEIDGGFQANVPEQSPTTPEAPSVMYNVTRAPKWLKRPASVSFGFGGWTASVSSKEGDKVNIEAFSESFAGLREGSDALDSMLMDLTSDDPSAALNWCQNASDAAETPTERLAWDALGIMFQTDSRRNLLKYIGFDLPPLDPGDDIAMPVFGLVQSQPLAVPVRPIVPSEEITADNKPETVGMIDEITNGTAEVKLDGPAPWEITDTADDINVKDSILDGDDTLNGEDATSTNKINGSLVAEGKTESSRSFVGKSKKEIEGIIRKAIIVGDFKTAVDACLHIDRTADALVIAHAGGPYLWQQTQSDYLTKAALSSNGSSVVAAVAGPRSKLDDYIRQSAEGGKETWKEALAVLLTYSPAEEIQESCTALGQRLLLKGDHSAALFCFICAGNTRMATTAWMRDRPSTGTVTAAMMTDRVERLTILVQRIRLLTAATLLAYGEREIGVVRALDEVSGSVFCEFAALLAMQGDLSLSITYLSNLDPSFTSVYGTAEDLHAKVSECLTMEDSAATANDQYNMTTDNTGMPYNTYDPTGYGYPAQDPYGAPDMQQYSTPAPIPGGGGWNNPPPPAPLADSSYPTAAPAVSSYTTPAPPPPPVAASPMPTAPTPPRPNNVFTSAPTADRSAYDPSTAYAQAPDFNQNAYQTAPPPPAPVINPMSVAPSLDANTGTMPVAPPVAPVNHSIPPNPISGGAYGAPAPGMDGYMGLQPEVVAPPPPPPTDADAPPPMPYHMKARPGSGSTLPPSAEVAVAESRRTRPLSAAGTPGGPPRRTTSTSSSLSALGLENTVLERADVGKIPAPQQVIVKALRGSYTYSRTLNQTPRYMKKLDDVSKRLGKLLAALNNGLIEESVVELLIQMSQAIEKGNYDEAGRTVSILARQHWDANSQWIQGLKRLIDCALTGR